MARTQEYSAKQVADALRATNGVVMQAANLLRCDPSTVYRYAHRYTTVKDAMVESRNNTYAEAQGYLVAMMRDRDHKDHKWAVEQILKHYGDHVDDGLDFTPKEKKELTGKDGGAIVLDLVNDD